MHLTECLSLCHPDFPIPELTPTQNYLGPQPEAANQCRCSTVFYNMLSACAVCQGAEVSTCVLFNYSFELRIRTYRSTFQLVVLRNELYTGVGDSVCILFSLAS